jgi:Gpi18-like mannosyltransferase
MTEVTYDDGLIVFIVLAICWAISFEFAVIVGLSWAIAGVSRSNAMKESAEEE